ILRGAHALKT
ncbi:unnamed protein product, partial [Allacma fusca]